MLTPPLSRLQHPREVVRQFTPNWFTATIGTGILALALNQFPLAVPGLKRRLRPYLAWRLSRASVCLTVSVRWKG
jgi:hypothetical protein